MGLPMGEEPIFSRRICDQLFIGEQVAVRSRFKTEKISGPGQ